MILRSKKLRGLHGAMRAHATLYSNKARSPVQQRGFALLLVMFLLALLILLSVPLAERVITQGRRDREEEMIWRGKQYVRGIELFNRKNAGRLPTSMDDLTKPKLGGVRFMRQAYKDPMNKEDGSWRLIYVGAAGQLIGSLKPHPVNVQLGALGGAAGASGAGSSNQNGLLSQGGLQGANAPGTAGGPGQPGSNAAAGAQITQGSIPGAGNGNSSGSDSSSVTETPTIVGGNIIGVGSKVNKKSIKYYDKAKNYRQFEFIWDPSQDAAALAGQLGIAPPPSAPGTNPFGSQPNRSGPGGLGSPGLGNAPVGPGFGGPGNAPQNPPQNPAPPPNPAPGANPPPVEQ